MSQTIKSFLFGLLALSMAGNAGAYSIYFNKIICVNPWRSPLSGSKQSTAGTVIGAFMTASGRGTKGDTWNDELTLYWDNKKSGDVDFLDAKFMSSLTGSSGGLHNDRFYITYKDKAREGMVLPLRGGDKDMFANAHWLPTAAEGNPSMIGQSWIRYYLWEADAVSRDNKIGYFTIDLGGMVNKGPQLVMLTMPANFDNKYVANAVYVIEYEVKP